MSKELERKIAEAEFHDEREMIRTSDPEMFKNKYTNKKFYSITKRSSLYLEKLCDDCKGKKVLDYCCGLGGNSIRMARAGGYVTGVDISELSVQTAKKRAKDASLEEYTEFYVMDAENMSFQDDTFDIILCSGVLHHLDLEKAYKELSRVLKANGQVICVEAMSHNPLIMMYRKRTPHLRTKWEVDHILSISDILRGKKYFNEISIKYFHLTTIGAVIFRNTRLFSLILDMLGLIDSYLLKLPGIRLMAWMSVFIMSKPVKDIKETKL